jgi:hypothetical protein
LNGTENELRTGVAMIENALLLLKDPQDLYRRMSPDQRHLLNQALFDKLYVDVEGVSGATFNPPFSELLEAPGARQRVISVQETSAAPKRGQEARNGTGRANRPLYSTFFREGLSKGVMVGAEVSEFRT